MIDWACDFGSSHMGFSLVLDVKQIDVQVGTFILFYYAKGIKFTNLANSAIMQTCITSLCVSFGSHLGISLSNRFAHVLVGDMRQILKRNMQPKRKGQYLLVNRRIYLENI